MLLSPLLLVCMSDMSECRVETNGSLVSTQEQCMFELRAGIEVFESAGLVVMDYQCVPWEKKQPT